MTTKPREAEPSEFAPPAIAIVGMSLRVPGARNLAEFWPLLRDGRESLRTFSDEELRQAGVDPQRLDDPAYVKAAGTLEGFDHFDAAFFGYSPREAELIDPQQRLFLEQAFLALEHAGLEFRNTGRSVGVFAGSGLNQYLIDHVAPQRELLETVGEYQAAIANDKDFLATRVAYKLDLRGPSLSVQTACSTSLVAIGLACQSLADYECDSALAGGVSLRLPQIAGYLYQDEGILSPDGHCRPFDAKAAGTVPSSGVGVVVLKRLEDAEADGDRVHAVIRGWAINNDGGRKAGFTAPRAEGQKEVIRGAQSLANFAPETISYVEAHGTGTRLGDPIEVRALTAAFNVGRERRASKCALGSLKSNLGHLDQAAGVAGLIKTVLAMQHRELPPTLHFESPNPEIDFANSPFEVVHRLRPWTSDGPRRAGVSSFGIGGTNAHVVLEEALQESSAEPDDRTQLLCLSAKTPTALEAASANLASQLQQTEDLTLADVAHTLVRRQAFEHRRILFADHPSEAVEALKALDPERVFTGRSGPGQPSVAFLFPGQGAQYVGMARGLVGRLPTFSAELDRCLDRFASQGLDLRATLCADPADAEAAKHLARTDLAQAALFSVEYALAKEWLAWGLEPDALLGHSIGEYAAACLAGIFSFEDAVRLVADRGRLLGELPGGAVLSVQLGENSLTSYLNDSLAFAGYNAPEICAVSGSEEAIAKLAERLAADGVQHRRLQTSHAFHSAVVDPILDRFRDEVRRADLRAPDRRILANVTGTWMRAEQATDPDYWVRQLRQTVRFSPAVERLLDDPERVLLEVGPGEGLATLTRQQPAARGRTILSSLRHPHSPADDFDVLLRTAGQLWIAGTTLAPNAYARTPRRRVELPGYPFEDERHWLDPGERPKASVSGWIRKNSDLSQWFYLPTWRRILAEKNKTADGPGLWLVIADSAGLGETWTTKQREAGIRTLLARPGESFGTVTDDTFEIEAHSPESVDELLAEVSDEDLTGVVYLAAFGVDHPAADPLPGLLQLAQTLGRQRRPLDLIAVTSSLHPILGDEPEGPHYRAENGVIAGLWRVVPQEFPHLRCRLLDFDARAPRERQTSWLDAELSATESLVAWRGHHRFVRQYDQLPVPATESSRWRADAHYLITGGLGRFGLIIAHSLAQRFPGIRLTLIDQVDPADQREAWTELRDANPNLLLLRADVIDPASLKAAVRLSLDTFGPIQGVLHAAGAPAEDYRTLTEIDVAYLEHHLRPKIFGARHLYQALSHHQALDSLEFGALVSSLAAVLGGIGLAAFAAADSALDLLATEFGDRWIAINWEGWQQLFEEDSILLGQQQNELMMQPEEVAETLDRALSVHGASRLVAATGDLHTRMAQWSQVGTASIPSSERYRDTGVPFRAPQTAIECRVAELWQDVLGVDQVGLDDDFFMFGGSSLSGLQILSQLRQDFDVELPLRSFFEHRTVAGIAALIVEEQQQQAAEDARLEELLAEIEALSDEEVEAELLDDPPSDS